MSETQWYYGKNGQQMGPVSQGDIQQLILTGQLTGDDYIWRAGLDAWAKASDMAEFAGLLSTGQSPSFHSAPTAAPTSSRTVDDILGPSFSSGSAFNRGGGGGGGLGGAYIGEYAGFWKRFVAAFIDGLILMIPIFGISFVLGLVFGLGASVIQDQDAVDAMMVLLQLSIQILQIVITMLYFALMESSSRQATIGKMAMGLIVTDGDGYPLSFWRALGRNVGKLVSQLICMIGYIMAAFTARKQALHDMMANCLVVVR